MSSSFVQAVPAFPLAGEAASLVAALIWACSMSLYTFHARGLSAETINLFKNLVAAVCLGVAVLVVRAPLPEDTSAFAMLALSGVIGISLGDTALFGALKRLGAQMTSASQCIGPPISALIAVFVLGEVLTPLETFGLFVTATAVAGIVYFGQGRGSALAGVPRRTIIVGLALAAVAAICQAVGLVIARQALQNVHVLYGTIVRIAPAIVVLTAMALASPRRQPLSAVFRTRSQGFWLTFASFAGTFLGLILMSLGAKYAKAGIAAALTSTYPIWIIPLARVYLREPGNWQGIACTVFAVAGIALMVA